MRLLTFNICCCQLSGWRIWISEKVCFVPVRHIDLKAPLYDCIWMCVCVFLHAWAGNCKEWVSSQLMGCLEWARPLGQQWDEVQLLFKVCRAVRGVYSRAAAGEGYKQRGAKRWVKCEESEGLERQRERQEHTVNRKTSGPIFISGQIPLWLNWYWGL